MSFLLKFLNPKFLIPAILVIIIGYKEIEVINLESNLKTVKLNYQKAKSTSKMNLDTIKDMSSNIDNLKKSKNISDTSYNNEIKRLKALIFSLNKKQKYTDSIKIEKIKVPVLVKGKTVYIDKCKDIEVKHISPQDSNNSVIRIISNIGF